ncbi:hypothetical protein P175DRAFT_0490301 [Aspergillus ochraceoroseus IBT 24754]|uniref:RelA/SpoT domain-containing protein n=1 Tax=Aspergillus ochraceoroseus IBT 24754 TaxID=1392256 RepID=A0A2T5M9N5_9EURO|nr:uncharacterized protein P175DRAFT_0490301 [Aspergillus ochraceoroseus IBT 24754]PTU25244.1 hypothetical protein P175DRAFT_0490301 [Aspergillus ochraceoroseus IBT 24754]
MGAKKGTSVIDTFVESEYPPIRSNYKLLAEKVEEVCKRALHKADIPHFTSSRVKDKERLRAKLEKIQERRRVEWTPEEILKNVFDFAGVRIALYRPEQKSDIRQILEKDCRFTFHDPDTKTFGDEVENGGKASVNGEFHHHRVHNKISTPKYEAIHYIVSLHPEDLQDLHSYPVEVQVMSVLQSSWAQIQHDLTYKQLSGHLSKAEETTLESLGRVMTLGESFLYQLSIIQDERKLKATGPFKNVYELGNFLWDWFVENYGMEVEDLGPLSALKALLEKTKLNNRKELSEVLTSLIPTSKNPRPIERASARVCPGMELRPAVFIMNHIITTHDDELNEEWRESLHREEMRSQAMLEVIMSTILWLFDFFPLPFWELALKSGGSPHQQEVRIERLSWLASTRPGELMDSPADFLTNPEDRDNVNELWNWFNGHHSRAVQLAFRISKYVIVRDVVRESCLFDRVFSRMGQTLRNDFQSNNGRSSP